jgi:hypothetical protein
LNIFREKDEKKKKFKIFQPKPKITVKTRNASNKDLKNKENMMKS